MKIRIEEIDALIAAATRDADEITSRIVGGRYRGNLSDVETLRNHVRRLATALERVTS